MTACPFSQGFDFTDPDVLLAGMPVSEFAQLRKTAPVWWNEQPPGATVFDDGGYWVITRCNERSPCAAGKFGRSGISVRSVCVPKSA